MKTKENVGVLFSGGKDSCYAAYIAKKKGYNIKCLITIVSENPESYMFHTPRINMASEQAKAMEIPIIVFKTKGEREKELADLEEAIKKAISEHNIETIVTGAIASVYQKSRIEKICDKLGLKCFNPLWNIDPEKYWKELFSNNFKAKIVSVAAEGLDKKWIGKIIDEENFVELKKLAEKYKFHLAFEGGEAETLVIDCPLFKKKLKNN